MKKSSRDLWFLSHYCTICFVFAILAGIVLCAGCLLGNPAPLRSTENNLSISSGTTGSNPDLSSSVIPSNSNPITNPVDKTPRAIIFTDSNGQKVILNDSPKRIVCLNGDSARILVAIGAGDTVVGVLESTTKDTVLVKKLPNAVSIGGAYNQPNIEQVISLKPDLVIALTSASPTLMGRLTEANITVVYLDGYVIEKMPDFVESVSAISGSPSSADRYLNYYHGYYDLVNTRLAEIPKDTYPKVYFEGSSNYSTVGVGSGGDSLIRVAHGKNIAGSINAQWPMVSPEFVLNENPDVIIKIAYPAMLANSTIAQIRDQVISRPGLSGTNAAKNGRVYVIDVNVAYGDQGIITLLYCAKALYPDRFKDIDPERLLVEYSDDFIPRDISQVAFYP